MVTLEDARAFRGVNVRMEFTDGLVVTAKIVDVQDDQDHDQVAYELLQIVSGGDLARAMQPGGFYASDLEEIAKLERA